MKNEACTECGAAFVSERTGAGRLQTRLCPDCLEEKIAAGSFPHHEVKESWFRLLALEPPPSFFERKIDFEEWRTCNGCGRRFKTHPDIEPELCPPCLEEAWEATPLEPAFETPISPELVRTLSELNGKKVKN